MVNKDGGMQHRIMSTKNVTISHSLIAPGAVVVSDPLYFGHSR